LPRDRYLEIPADTAPRARQYIHNLEQQYPARPDLVKAVLQRFSSDGYFYTRQPPPLLGDPTDAFLFDTKRGYCEHFASSFTVLMRLAGIPARVVTGYQGGEMNPLSNYLIVRQSDAHAWSEIYLEDRGWLRVDPTAVIPPGNIENVNDVDRLRADRFEPLNTTERNWLAASAKQLRYAWDMVNNRWNQWVIGYSNQSQKSLFRALGIPEISWRGLSYVLFITLAVFIMVLTVNIFQAQRLRKNPLEKVYQRFLQKLRPLHLEKSPAEGAMTFSQRVAREYPDQSDSLLSIARHYNQLRYAQSGQASLEGLRNAIDELQMTQKP